MTTNFIMAMYVYVAFTEADDDDDEDDDEGVLVWETNADLPRMRMLSWLTRATPHTPLPFLPTDNVDTPKDARAKKAE